MQSGFRPGDQLREIRNRLGVTTREVEELSRKIAVESANEEFCISNAWLTQLENKNSVPSIYKLFSLSVIYRIKFTQLLTLFGISLADTIRYQLSTPLQNTHLAAMEAPDADKAITFPIRFDRGFTLEKTNLISRMVEAWERYRCPCCRCWTCATANTAISGPMIISCPHCCALVPWSRLTAA